MTATGNYVSVMRRRPRYLSALGLIIVETTGMEFLLGELLGAVMRTDPEIGVAIYHAPKANRARLDILANALEAAFVDGHPGKKALEKIIGKARGCIDRRNAYVHGLWGLSSNRRKIFVRMPPAQSKEVRLQELKHLARDLQEVSTLAETHKRAIYKQLASGAWTKKSP